MTRLEIPARERGYSLVELMIAILIALFLLGGLVTLVMGTRRTSSTQTQLSQLQDSERVAMMMMTNVLQQAGYFPNPTVAQNWPANIFPVVGSFTQSGQSVFGTYASAAPGDTVAVRFAAPATDTNKSVVNCDGTSNTDVVTHAYTNLFQVATPAGATVPYLQCVVTTDSGAAQAAVNLVSGVKSLSVLYGVSGTGDASVQTYETAAQVTAAAAWQNVTAAKVRITFMLPAYGSSGGQYSTGTQYFERVIPIMNRTGVGN